MERKLINAIKRYILEDVDRKETISELRRYRESFPFVPDYNWYRYGNILPYYSDIRSFYKDSGVKSSNSDTTMCAHFCRHVGKAIDEILEENRGI